MAFNLQVTYLPTLSDHLLGSNYLLGTKKLITYVIYLTFSQQSLLRGWFVRLLKGEYQTKQIHPDGWFSGVFYLQVPKSSDREDGSTEFSLWGYGYPTLKNNHRKMEK
jgi:hypothetical protein